MSKRQRRRLIAKFADRLEDGFITESMYGIPVKRGNDPIDQLIHQIEMNFLDWDWNNKSFQKIMSQVYKGKPPTSPQQLAGELQKSTQDPTLKQKLNEILMSTKAAAAAAPQAPAPQVAPAPAPQAAAAPQAPAPTKLPIRLPAASLSAPPPLPAYHQRYQAQQASAAKLKLHHGQTYTVEYQNFRGQRQTYKNAKFVTYKGTFVIFEFPRPAGRPNPGWKRGKKLINGPQDVANRQAELMDRVNDYQQELRRQVTRRFRVNGAYYTLAELKRQLPGWTKSIKDAEFKINHTTQSLNNSIAYAQQEMRSVKHSPPVPLEKSFKASNILSVK